MSSKNQEKLYHILVEILPEYEPINKDFRPKWLETRPGNPRSRLELDFWLPRRKIGIELQGEQHYKNIMGKSGLRRQQRRDKAKAEMMKKLGYTLITIRYNEVRKDIVRSKIIPLIKEKEDA